MNRLLRERRQQIARRHEAALARWPTREGEPYERELRAVVEDLTTVAKAADDPSSDPVEVAITYRWLGDAYFDLAGARRQGPLEQGVMAYMRAEELLQDVEAPVEKAKLDFNYGNTLRGLSQGVDVGLLEAAQTRYERAVHTFRSHHLADHAAAVEQQLRSIDPQLRLVRKQSELRGGLDRLKALEGRAKSAGPADRERIEVELEALRKVRTRGDVGDAMTDALKAIREQTEEHPERFDDFQDNFQRLEESMKAEKSLVEGDTPPNRSTQSSETPEQAFLGSLQERLCREEATGNVAPERAATLADLLTRFAGTMSEGGDDLDSLQKRTQKMRDVLKQAMDPALAPTWDTPDPEPGSRADRALRMLDPLKRHITAEKGRSLLPSGEASVGTDLLTRMFKLEKRIRDCQNDDNRVAKLEGELWRLSLEVQRHARRYHLVLAQPDFPMAETHAKPKSVFLSGGDCLRRAANQLAAREDLELWDGAGRGDYARERWNQLCSVTVAVFDLGVHKGAEQAQVCYELGLALALGAPSVLVSRPRHKLPFDANLRPVRFHDEPEQDADTLDEAIRHALQSIVWGGTDAGAGQFSREALAWLDRRFGERVTTSALRVNRDLVAREVDDAVAFQKALEQLLGMLGAHAPTLLLAAWPAAYPDPDAKPHCFHVLPFRPVWSGPTSGLARDACESRDWTYSRGDESAQQRIMRGIWSEIGRSSGVIVDITGHSPNVAVELGLTHALGRRYRVVAQGDPEKHVFPSLEKVQVHAYKRGPRYAGFEEAVEGLIES